MIKIFLAPIPQSETCKDCKGSLWLPDIRACTYCDLYAVYGSAIHTETNFTLLLSSAFSPGQTTSNNLLCVIHIIWLFSNPRLKFTLDFHSLCFLTGSQFFTYTTVKPPLQSLLTHCSLINLWSDVEVCAEQSSWMFTLFLSSQPWALSRHIFSSLSSFSSELSYCQLPLCSCISVWFSSSAG